MELTCNNIIKLRNGKVGAVTCFNDRPAILVFEAYTNPISRYDAELKNKNTDYDIVEVRDGNGVERLQDIYRKRFDLEALPLIWKREE